MKEIALDRYFRDYGDNPGFQQPDAGLTEIMGNVVALRNCNGLLATYAVGGDTAIEFDTGDVDYVMLPSEWEFDEEKLKQSIRSLLHNWAFDYEIHHSDDSFDSMLVRHHRSQGLWRLVAEVATEELSSCFHDLSSEAYEYADNFGLIDDAV